MLLYTKYCYIYFFTLYCGLLQSHLKIWCLAKFVLLLPTEQLMVLLCSSILCLNSATTNYQFWIIKSFIINVKIEYIVSREIHTSQAHEVQQPDILNVLSKIYHCIAIRSGYGAWYKKRNICC